MTHSPLSQRLPGCCRPPCAPSHALGAPNKALLSLPLQGGRGIRGPQGDIGPKGENVSMSRPEPRMGSSLCPPSEQHAQLPAALGAGGLLPLLSSPLGGVPFPQGLPGIDGKDGTPGIPGVKVRSRHAVFSFLCLSPFS